MKNKDVGGFSTVVFEIPFDVNGTSDLYGKFLQLKSLHSPYLSQYVEFTRLACGMLVERLYSDVKIVDF